MGNTNKKLKKSIKYLNTESPLTQKRYGLQKRSSSKNIKNTKLNLESKEDNVEIKQLKSLSDNKLIQISSENNREEMLSNSSETNSSSIKSNINEIPYVEEDETGSEADEDSVKSSDNKNKDKNKVLIITNNIKKVFVDSKLNINNNNNNINNIREQSPNSSLSDMKTDDTTEDEENNNNINNNNRMERTPSISTFDYELNIFRDAGAVRESYISKLISMNVWNPSIKPKNHNSLIIFDWDDTLLPTSFLTPNDVFSENIQLSPTDSEKMKEIEKNVYKILKESIEKGNVYIITNAGINWVQFSANIFYPSISELLKKIKIISARVQYEKSFPGNLRQWKIQAFLNLLNEVDEKLVTNIICVGDSLFEMEAGRILASKFKEAFIKTIKFREAPKLDELLKQLKLITQQFGTIYSTIKNLTIRIEKKKREK